ncbi:unnamed protein product [Gongylonema pulchrum]|uniref:Transmembrane protein n=1 Tax=Gongylonema pulchrum TaxID=637853 RepID=A0A183DC37_9BILA|nr:unnamed protein product [Gongylonema pulchrum]
MSKGFSYRIPTLRRFEDVLTDVSSALDDFIRKNSRAHRLTIDRYEDFKGGILAVLQWRSTACRGSTPFSWSGFSTALRSLHVYMINSLSPLLTKHLITTSLFVKNFMPSYYVINWVTQLLAGILAIPFTVRRYKALRISSTFTRRY